MVKFYNEGNYWHNRQLATAIISDLSSSLYNKYRITKSVFGFICIEMTLEENVYKFNLHQKSAIVPKSCIVWDYKNFKGSIAKGIVYFESNIDFWYKLEAYCKKEV